GVNLQPLLLAGAVIAAFIGLWYALGTVAGILWTPRALVIAGILAVLGAAGFWTPWGLDAMLLADVLLIVLIWLDATLAQTVVVYPPLVSVRLRASVAEALRRRDVGSKQIRRLGEGRLFESLREWVPGDDLRHIDWKATARRAKVITRQYEAERRQQVLLVLDTGRLMTADVAAGVARLDFAVQAALELAYAAAQHDDNVGIMTFADGVQHFVAPERGRTGVRRVMDVLAEVQPKLVEPDYPGAFRYLAARDRKRALT